MMQPQPLLEGVEFQSLDDDDIEGAQVIDAVVILRYQHPEWENARVVYLVTKSTEEHAAIGLTGISLDRMREQSLKGWGD